MKNIFIFILGLIIGAVVMYFYCQTSHAEPIVRAPKGLISTEQAKTLAEAYNPRHQLISDSIVKRAGGDNRSSWYSLADVRNYLNYAEKEADQLGYKMDGVRIYLGAYPKDAQGAGYTTLFLVPTGTPMKATASMFGYNLQFSGGDIPGGGVLNMGGMGDPPHANYPQ